MISENISEEEQLSCNYSEKKSYFKTIKPLKEKENIFCSKKLKRNGLLERKIMKRKGINNVGRWNREEHNKFMEGCRNYGANWKMIQHNVVTRTTAQIRSHAQKYVIKLCKKYDIEIRSRRRVRFVSEHLNYPYRRKGKTKAIPIEKMTDEDRNFILNFNFYDKKLNLEILRGMKIQKKKIVFRVEKESLYSTSEDNKDKNEKFSSVEFESRIQASNDSRDIFKLEETKKNIESEIQPFEIFQENFQIESSKKSENFSSQPSLFTNEAWEHINSNLLNSIIWTLKNNFEINNQVITQLTSPFSSSDSQLFGSLKTLILFFNYSLNQNYSQYPNH